MSSSCCGSCGCDPCLCENPYQPDVDNLKEGTPVIQITGEPDTSCVDPDDICPIGPQCEEFEIPTGIVLAADPVGASLITVRVCDSSIYTVGMCVTIYATNSDNPASNQVVLRVDSILDLRTVALKQYNNASSNLGATLGGTMYICPMSHCLEETEGPGVAECHQFKALTDTDFSIPAFSAPPLATSAVSLTECTDLEAGDRIHIRNDAGLVGVFDIFSIVDGIDLVLTNTGLPGSESFPPLIAAGARVSSTPFVLPELPAPAVPPAVDLDYTLNLVGGVLTWVEVIPEVTSLNQADIVPVPQLTAFETPYHEVLPGNAVPDMDGTWSNVIPPKVHDSLGLGATSTWDIDDTFLTVPPGYTHVAVATREDPDHKLDLQLVVFDHEDDPTVDPFDPESGTGGLHMIIRPLAGWTRHEGPFTSPLDSAELEQPTRPVAPDPPGITWPGQAAHCINFAINPGRRYIHMFLHDPADAEVQGGIGTRTGRILSVKFF